MSALKSEGVSIAEKLARLLALHPAQAAGRGVYDRAMRLSGFAVALSRKVHATRRVVGASTHETVDGVGGAFGIVDASSWNGDVEVVGNVYDGVGEDRVVVPAPPGVKPQMWSVYTRGGEPDGRGHARLVADFQDPVSAFKLAELLIAAWAAALWESGVLDEAGAHKRVDALRAAALAATAPNVVDAQQDMRAPAVGDAAVSVQIERVLQNVTADPDYAGSAEMAWAMQYLGAARRALASGDCDGARSNIDAAADIAVRWMGIRHRSQIVALGDAAKAIALPPTQAPLAGGERVVAMRDVLHDVEDDWTVSISP